MTLLFNPDLNFYLTHLFHVIPDHSTNTTCAVTNRIQNASKSKMMLYLLQPTIATLRNHPNQSGLLELRNNSIGMLSGVFTNID